MKLAKPKKLKKSKSRSYLKKKADLLFSKAVRSSGRCELRGLDFVRCGGVLQCAHIIGRANMRLRYDLKNALCICSGHHIFYTHNPEKWREIIQLYFGDYQKYIDQHKNEYVKVDYEEIIETYK